MGEGFCTVVGILCAIVGFDQPKSGQQCLYFLRWSVNILDGTIGYKTEKESTTYFLEPARLLVCMNAK